MSRKDYIIVAETLGHVSDDRDRVAALEFFCRKAQADNGGFNANIFRNAVHKARQAMKDAQ